MRDNEEGMDGVRERQTVMERQSKREIYMGRETEIHRVRGKERGTKISIGGYDIRIQK